MAREFPSGSFENWTRCQVLLPHVAPMFDKKPTEEELLQDWAQVLYNAGWYLCMQGRYREAEGVARKAAETREDLAGQDAVGTLDSMSILALVLQYQAWSLLSIQVPAVFCFMWLLAYATASYSY
ncbi:hypothetical protein DM02DRAFT_428564 [Periconia macrospinosa]|uniref:Uncharacterized protein n=1 Tax=Periconia macrospinosa TaxID=97972 RepID=A0A2V1DN68_9PLEO|nr:hypothetical protein DM02DRAFT_428564 [Periconia macrospinosa]